MYTLKSDMNTDNISSNLKKIDTNKNNVFNRYRYQRR